MSLVGFCCNLKGRFMLRLCSFAQSYFNFLLHMHNLKNLNTCLVQEKVTGFPPKMGYTVYERQGGN